VIHVGDFALHNDWRSELLGFEKISESRPVILELWPDGFLEPRVLNIRVALAPIVEKAVALNLHEVTIISTYVPATSFDALYQLDLLVHWLVGERFDLRRERRLNLDDWEVSPKVGPEQAEVLDSPSRQRLKLNAHHRLDNGGSFVTWDG
jgi:hypothetical protein